MSSWYPLDSDEIVNLGLVCGRFKLAGTKITFYKPDAVTVLKEFTYSSQEVATEKFNQLAQRLAAPFGVFQINELNEIPKTTRRGKTGEGAPVL